MDKDIKKLFDEPTDQADKNKLTGKDAPAIVMVGLFWLIAVIVVLVSKHIPAKKKGKIIGFGTLIAFGLYCAFALMSNLARTTQV